MKLYLSSIKQPILEKQILILKIEDAGFCGISSLSSWPHLGDPSLQELKSDLLNHQQQPLVQKALYFALQDLQEKNIKTMKFPKIHKLIKDESVLAKSSDFEKIKLKPKGNYKTLAESLNQLSLKPNSLRIDFNNSLSFKSFESFLALLSSSSLDAIDFIEDPFFYDEKLWGEIKKNYQTLKLAVDHISPHKDMNFDYYIWKPAKQFYKDRNYKIIPTHYMSDTIEWYCSLWESSLYEDLMQQYCGFGMEHLSIKPYLAGDEVKVGKHWNHKLDQFQWTLELEDFQLAFDFT